MNPTTDHREPGLAVEPTDGGLRLVGEFDLAEVPVIESAVARVAREGTVTLDMSELTFLDSSGLNAILRLHHRLAEAGGRLCLARPTPRVLQVLAVTGVDRVVTITD